MSPRRTLATITGIALVACTGCGGDRASRSTAPPGAHAGDRVQIPADAIAVMDLDVPRVRRSVVWHGVRRVVGRGSSLATLCPDVLATARSATAGLRLTPQREGLHAAFVILRGIDRARTLACLRAPAAEPPPPLAAEPSPTRPEPCQRYDEAVHQLARCDRLPASVAEEPRRAQQLLARAAADKATADNPAAACTVALGVVEGIHARRRELGWLCADEEDRKLEEEIRAKYVKGPPQEGSQDPFRRVVELDASTFQLDQLELVHFVDDHTAVTVRHGTLSGDDDGPHFDLPDEMRKQLRADLDAMLARPATPRWYDAPRAARDPAPAIWLAIDPSLLLAKDGDEPYGRPPELPGRIHGTIDVERDLRFDLRLAGKTYKETMFVPGILMGMLADDETQDLVPGATATTTCAAPTPTGPRADRCTRAIAQARTLVPTVDPAQVSDEQATRSLSEHSELLACVEKPWSERYLACLEAARTLDALSGCRSAEPGLEVNSMDDIPPVCGAHGIRLQATLPLLAAESLKLLEVAEQDAKRDCSPGWPQAPSAVLVGPANADSADKIALAARVCDDDCMTVDLSATHDGHSDRRWHEYGDIRLTTCPGPFNDTPTRDKLHAVNDRCGEDQVLRFTFEARTARICRGPYPGVCATLPTPAPVREVSIDTRARFAAIVSGAPGAQTIETWDLASKRRLGTFAAGTTKDRPCARAQLLDDTLLVSTGGCETSRPVFTAWIRIHESDLGNTLPRGAYLTTLQGRRIATVGGAQPLAILARPLPITGKRWAFIAETGDAVVIQDVATGAVERRIATGEPVAPGSVGAGADDLGHVVLAYGGDSPRTGSVTLVETATGAVRSIAPLPACPAGVYLP